MRSENRKRGWASKIVSKGWEEIMGSEDGK
jgi:hypothetical protein